MCCIINKHNRERCLARADIGSEVWIRVCVALSWATRLGATRIRTLTFGAPLPSVCTLSRSKDVPRNTALTVHVASIAPSAFLLLFCRTFHHQVREHHCATGDFVVPQCWHVNRFIKHTSALRYIFLYKIALLLVCTFCDLCI